MTTTIGALAARAQTAIEGPEGPPLAWTLRAYRATQLRGDVLAGLTVAALIVPLSIGYAGVAGLPPEMGLYASLAPLVVYAILGSARTLIVGPDASTAAVIGATIAPLAAAGDDRVRLAGALGLLVAAIFIGARLARLGFLADFLSRPILVGFLAGIGITVALGQVETILGGPAIAAAVGVLGGIDWTSANIAAVAEAVAIAVRASGADVASVIVGVAVVAVVLVGRRIAPRIPMALPALLIALVASALLDLQAAGVEVLGPVPAGLPPLGIPTASPAELVGLLPGALGLALLSFADTTATGRSFAARHGERTDANRELVALGAADAAASITGGYPVSSSPSRTSAAEASGSSSQVTGLVAATALAVVLLLLTGPLALLPMPALGAVILVSVLGIIDISSMRSIWRLKRSEGAIAFIAMTGVVLYGTLAGIGIAALLAALNIVRRAAGPRISEEGRRPDGSWRGLGRVRDARRVRGVIAVRFPGPLFFANATALRVRVRELLAARPDATAVVVDLAATSDIDLTAGESLRQLADDLGREGVRLAVANPLGRVRDELRAYGLGDLMEPTGGTHGTIDAAVVGLGLDPAMPAEEAAEVGGAGGPAPAPAVPGRPPARDALVLRVVGVGLATIAVAAAVAFVVGSLGTPPAGPREVPNLVGMTLGRATVAASDAGFELIAPLYVRQDDRPEGTVVDQNPPAGTLADPGSEIQPLVATGRQLVLLPDVVGLSEAAAIARLTGLGLTVWRAPTVEDPSVAAGIVLETDPAPGTQVATGTSIAYVVSAGPPPSPTAAPTPTPGPTQPAATPTPSASPGATPSGTPVATPPPSEVPGESAAPTPGSPSEPTPTAGPSETPAP